MMNGEEPTEIADVGAASSCGTPVWSECGNYRLTTDYFLLRGRKPNKPFHYAGGDIAAADKIKELPFDVGEEVQKVQMVPGI